MDLRAVHKVETSEVLSREPADPRAVLSVALKASVDKARAPVEPRVVLIWVPAAWAPPLDYRVVTRVAAAAPVLVTQTVVAAVARVVCKHRSKKTNAESKTANLDRFRIYDLSKTSVTQALNFEA